MMRLEQRELSLRVVVTWIAYAALFIPLHDALNDISAIFLLVPVLVTAWTYGLAGSVVAIVLMWPLQAILYLSGDHELGLDMFAGVDGLIGLSGFTVLALLTGYASRTVAGLTRLHTAKDRMVASVSHEVRNPLTGVLGLAELLDGDWESIAPDDRRDLVATIAAQARDAASIIEDLLIVARMGSGVDLKVHPENVDLTTVAGTVAAHARVPVVLMTDAAVAHADPARTRQVVTNLVSNAAKYGGPSRRISTGTGNGVAWLEVRDDGHGVDPNLLDLLFEPFSAGEHREATGIGLAVSRALARAMGGDVGYRREDGLSVFRLSLPAASPRTQVEAIQGGSTLAETSSE